MKKSIWARRNRYKIAIHGFFTLFSLVFILPVIMIISISFSSEAAVTGGSGYSLFPQEFSLDAYKLAFKNPQSIINGYAVTISISVVGTLGILLVCGMVAYAISRSNFKYRKIITYYIFFTMLFGAGTIPTYVIYTKYYHLGDNWLVYILPGLTGGAWNTFMFRTFFKGIPESLFESAKLDGARELTIFFKIAMPLSKPIFATIGFTTLIAKWNDWNTSLLYIRKDELYTLQYLLQRILNETEFLKNLMENQADISINLEQIVQTPSETLRYAMCVIAAGPMLFIFPFFQKYFEKGMVVGSVKG